MSGAGEEALERPRLGERLVFRFIAGGGWWLVLAGFALLVPVVVARALPGAGEVAAKVTSVIVPIALLFVVAGAIVAFLGRRSLYWRPRAGRAWSDARLSTAFGVLIAAVAIGVAGWTWLGIGPLVGLCMDTADMLRANGALSGAMSEPQFPGLILLPIAIAFVVPVLQLVAAWYLTIGAAALLALAWGPPTRLLRAFVMCLILQAALVAAGVYGVRYAQPLTSMIERHVRGSAATDWRYADRRVVLDLIDRYDNVSQSAANTLEYALGVEVLLLPLLLAFAATHQLRLRTRVSQQTGVPTG